MNAKLPRIQKNCPSCGSVFYVTQGQIDRGRGSVCSRACNAKHYLTKHGHTAGGETSPTYISWASMIARCTHKYATKYPEYGARGITVGEDWMDFRNFLRDMGERPAGTTIDRLDGSLGYFKGNCRWATPREQSDNTRVATQIDYRGEILTLAGLAGRLGVAKTTLRYRIRQGWPQDRWGA